MKRSLALACLAAGLVSWTAVAAPAMPSQAETNEQLTKVAEALLGRNGGNKLFYLPTHDVPATPRDWGYRFENVRFQSRDGTPLTGWFVPAQPRGKVKTKGTIVFSHGNAGSMGHHLGFDMWLVGEGYNVFTYDYRGFGQSGGAVDRGGMVADVHAALDYAAARKGTGPLISLGHSLGGAKSLVAIAQNHPPALKAVVTDAAFASYRDMARHVAGDVGGNIVSDELSPRDYVAKIAPLPLLIVHGTNDEVVPFSQGKLLFDKAKSPKTFYAVNGAGHGDALLANDAAYRRKLLAWLDARLAGK